MTEEKLTELEKRWAADEESEEPDHECCGSCAAGACCSEEEDPELATMKKSFIACPVIIGHFSPMVMIMADHKFFLGGVDEVDTTGISMIFPMEYQEMPIRDPNNPNAVSLQIGVKPVLNSLGIVDEIRFTHSMIYFLKAGRSEDKKLVQTYESAITQARAAMSNIVVPTMDDIHKTMNSGK